MSLLENIKIKVKNVTRKEFKWFQAKDLSNQNR